MLRSAENPIRVALLDDHPIVRHGLGKKFSRQPDFHVVGIYATGREMIAGLRSAPAEVLVVDFSLGPTEIDGINLLQLLKIKYPSSKILVASSHDDPATVALVMRAGAKGFVAKAEPLSALVAAIRIVAAGGTYTGEAGPPARRPNRTRKSSRCRRANAKSYAAAWMACQSLRSPRNSQGATRPSAARSSLQ
jgi:DNA-binding NarL/FixJ family response regulator